MDNQNKGHQLVLWGGVAIGVIALLSVMIFFMGKSEGAKGTSNSKTPPPVTTLDWKKGNPDAKVVLIEYSDFECPACGLYAPIVRKLVEKFPNDLLVAYRHFPLVQIHKNAEFAGRAAESAGKQGRFWDMHDYLFANQATWSKETDARKTFIEYSKNLKLDTAKFAVDVESEEIKAKIKQAYPDALALGINSTPSFFLNGKKITSPQSYEAFELLISDEIKKLALPEVTE